MSLFIIEDDEDADYECQCKWCVEMRENGSDPRNAGTKQNPVVTFGSLKNGAKFRWKLPHASLDKNLYATDGDVCQKLMLHGGLRLVERGTSKALDRSLWISVKEINGGGSLFTGDSYKDTPVEPL